MNGCHECFAEFIVSCGDAPEVFEPAEATLYGITVLVKRRREAGNIIFTVFLGWNVWRSPHTFNLLTDFIAIIALITMQHLCLRA